MDGVPARHRLLRVQFSAERDTIREYTPLSSEQSSDTSSEQYATTLSRPTADDSAAMRPTQATAIPSRHRTDDSSRDSLLLGIVDVDRRDDVARSESHDVTRSESPLHAEGVKYEDTNDLSLSGNLTERLICSVIEDRFKRDMIHTYIGDLIVIVNPYRDLPIYNHQYTTDYTEVSRRNDRPPHVYWVAGRAYERMRSTHTDQCVLVSGESGGGKTETTKHVIEHLTRISRSGVNDLHSRIVKVNPLLEAFGNAQTIMNHNSSRFGKFVQLNFADSGHLNGAFIYDYLLETSRVVQQQSAVDDHNYHIFYYLFAGMPPDALRYYYLERPENHRMLTGAHEKSFFRDADDEARCRRMFRETETIMTDIGLSANDISTVYACLAAVLYVTNIEFQSDDSLSDATVIVDEYPVKIVADLLTVNEDDLTIALISTTSLVSGTGEDVIALKTLGQASDGRDAVAKALYCRLFGWIVRKVNDSLRQSSSDERTAQSIGILDMSGFENLSENSFEQLCINVVNEKLHAFFTACVLRDEQASYAAEQIDWQTIHFENNDRLLSLFLGPPPGGAGDKKALNMFTILDDIQKIPMATDATLVDNWQHHLADFEQFKRTKGDPLRFAIRHFAEEVTYSADKFLEKNRYRLSGNLLSVLKRSGNDFVNDLFSAELSEEGCLSRSPSRIRKSTSRMSASRPVSTLRSGSVSTSAIRSLQNRGRLAVSSTASPRKTHNTAAQYFRRSLDDLMKKLKAAEPLFIRCIKPNRHQVWGEFDPELVSRQLKYSGVLQIAETRRMGYPVRVEFADFIRSYRMAGSRPGRQVAEPRSECEEILRCVRVPRDLFAIGRTKVFLKEAAVELLQTATEIRAAILLQTAIRGRRIRRGYARMKEQRRRQEEEEAEQRRRADLSQSSTQKVGQVNDGQIYMDIDDLPPPVPSSARPSVTLTPPDDDTADVPVVMRTSATSSATRSDPSTLATPTADYDGNENDDDDDWSWDVAQLVPRDRVSASESFDGIVKAMKVVTFLVLFIGVFASAFASTWSLLWLEAGLMKDTQTRETCRNQLLWVICVPYVIVFLESFFKSMFGRLLWPTPKIFITVLALESLHTVGLTTLVFAVLPHFGSLYALALLTSVGLLPAVAKLFFSRYRHVSSSGRAVLLTTADLLAVIAQVAAVVYPVYIRVSGWGEHFWKSGGGTFAIASPAHLHWLTPASLVLVSLKWWENFVPRSPPSPGVAKRSRLTRLAARLFGLKKTLHVYRTKMAIVTSVWNVLLTLAILYGIERLSGHRVTVQSLNPIGADSSDEDDDRGKELVYLLTYAPALIQITSSFLCYHFSSLACKLLMQKFSFCVPLLLSLPAVAVVVALQCHADVIGLIRSSDSHYEALCDAWRFDGYAHGLYLLVGAAWWLSLLWVGAHVWYPHVERLAMSEKLFVTRHYTGPLVVSSLLLNRRADDREMKKTKTGDFMVYDSASLSSAVLLRCDDAVRVTVTSASNTPVTSIYACATMWHENRQEMIQLLKSIFRMDADQSARKLATFVFKHNDPDIYNFEAHIFFDDAMETDDNEERVANSFVKLLVSCMDEAASSVSESEVLMPPPIRTPTPYGGKLTWTLQGGTNLVAHLKDKSKIRHLKRWSQVMYMYYILGYQLFMEGRDNNDNDGSKANGTASPEGGAQSQRAAGDHFGRSEIFNTMDSQLLEKAENTFILALDGDVDFKPDAVRLLVDSMKKNSKTAAACGRIHPIGAGPMVWYQIFEYAVGHWFQKSTEHVLGCVLCSPGCFSLFRGSALLDDNVMKRYTTEPIKASDFLQYDQGEDRWLCTLLLQQGYRVDYTAASDALTYAPEGFDEFFNQRRRWTPSTMANIVDLLTTSANTIRINDNISYLYIAYQFALMVSTILGPATIVLAIATAFETVFAVRRWQAYLLSLLPVVFQLVVCFTTKPKTQLTVCASLSTLYAGVMTVVVVGILRSVVTEGIYNPSLLFLAVLAGVFVFAAVIHPYEFSCLPYGLVYFLCIPAGYLVLVIYSFCNMNVISWGTREVPKKKTAEQLAAELKEEEEKAQRKKKSGGLFSFLSLDSLVRELRETLVVVFSSKQSASDAQMVQLLRTLHEDLQELKQIQRTGAEAPVAEGAALPIAAEPEPAPAEKPEEPEEPEEREEREEREEARVEDPENPDWLRAEGLGAGRVEQLDLGETLFWQQLIRKYLKPAARDAKREARLQDELVALRNNVSFAMWLVNGLWVLFNYMIQTDDQLRGGVVLGQRTSYLGLLFIVFFAAVMLLQIVGMIIHRSGTFYQLIAITELAWPWRRHRRLPGALGGDSGGEGGGSGALQWTVEEAVKLTKELQKPRCVYDEANEPPADYSDDDDDAALAVWRTSVGATTAAVGGLRRRQTRNTVDAVTHGHITATLRHRLRRRAQLDLQRDAYDQQQTNGCDYDPVVPRDGTAPRHRRRRHHHHGGATAPRYRQRSTGRARHDADYVQGEELERQFFRRLHRWTQNGRHRPVV